MNKKKYMIMILLILIPSAFAFMDDYNYLIPNFLGDFNNTPYNLITNNATIGGDLLVYGNISVEGSIYNVTTQNINNTGNMEVEGNLSVSGSKNFMGGLWFCDNGSHSSIGRNESKCIVI